MDFKPLTIGNLKVSVPIIQGGMGIGVSLSKLASAVASCGGVGVISAAQPGFNEPDFETNPLSANIRALKEHIKLARKNSSKGVIGVNIMCAATNYAKLVKASIEAGAQLIISGAGLPTNLPALCKDSDVKLAPIISSNKAASVLLKIWDKKHNTAPDAVIFEGPEAGGHLGFKKEDLAEKDSDFCENEIKEILTTLKNYEEKYEKKIPLIAAGGIYTGYDIAKYLKLGASGVQMATRFVTTHECDADIEFKNAYIKCSSEDIKIVKSPVGMPGRAIYNKFVEQTEKLNVAVERCYNCLSKCDPKTTPYCISDALINAVRGNVEQGLIFCGSSAHRIDRITSVKELIDELIGELNMA